MTLVPGIIVRAIPNPGTEAGKFTTTGSVPREAAIRVSQIRTAVIIRECVPSPNMPAAPPTHLQGIGLVSSLLHGGRNTGERCGLCRSIGNQRQSAQKRKRCSNFQRHACSSCLPTDRRPRRWWRFGLSSVLDIAPPARLVQYPETVLDRDFAAQRLGPKGSPAIAASSSPSFKKRLGPPSRGKREERAMGSDSIRTWEALANELKHYRGMPRIG